MVSKASTEIPLDRFYSKPKLKPVPLLNAATGIPNFNASTAIPWDSALTAHSGIVDAADRPTYSIDLSI